MGWCALFRINMLATDEDGFQVVRRRGRHTAAPKAPKSAVASVEPPIRTSLKAEDILARVEGYRYAVVHLP